MQVNQFPQEATSLGVDDLIGVDQKVGQAYVTAKAKVGLLLPVAVFARIDATREVTPEEFSALVFQTEVTDTHAAYNPTTGIFVAPVAGLYHLTFEIKVGTGTSTGGAGSLRVGRRVNGNTGEARFQGNVYGSTSQSWGNLGVVLPLRLEVDDSVEFMISNTAANTASLSADSCVSILRVCA